MLGKCWANIKPTLGKRHLFAGVCKFLVWSLYHDRLVDLNILGSPGIRFTSSSTLISSLQTSQQTQNICITSIQRWPNVFMIVNHPIYGVICYHVTLSRGSHDSQSPHMRKHVCPCGNFNVFVTNLFIIYKGWYVTFKSVGETGLDVRSIVLWCYVCRHVRVGNTPRTSYRLSESAMPNARVAAVLVKPGTYIEKYK